MSEVKQLGILGAGHLGPVVARLSIAAGYGVAIATSGDLDDLALIAEVLMPGAKARRAADAIVDADIVVLALPLHRFLAADTAALGDKLVIDAMNYWPSTDGPLAALEHSDLGSSELVAARLRDSALVKTLNHVGYHDLERLARLPGDVDRIALGVASDAPAAAATVTGFLDKIGFDAVPVGDLAAGRVLQPGGPVFGVPLRRADLEVAIQRARRAS